VWTTRYCCSQLLCEATVNNIIRLLVLRCLQWHVICTGSGVRCWTVFGIICETFYIFKRKLQMCMKCVWFNAIILNQLDTYNSQPTPNEKNFCELFPKNHWIWIVTDNKTSVWYCVALLQHTMSWNTHINSEITSSHSIHTLHSLYTAALYRREQL